MLNLHFISDALITAAYYSFPITLVYIVHRRRGIEFNWVMACLAVFIIASGTTHLMEMWNIWHSDYWLAGTVKAITAAASVPTAILLVRWVPKALALPAPSDLSAAVMELRAEVETRKHAETALRKSQQMFQRLFENAPDAMILVDRSDHIVRANAQSLALFTLSADEIVNRPLESLLPERYRARHRAHLAAYSTLPPPRTTGGGIELAGRQNDGTEFPVEIILSSLEIETGPHVLAVVRDITERKRASEALAASEAHYRNNFESLPVALFEVEFTEVLRLMHGVRSLTGYDWSGWLATHPEFVAAAMRALRITEVNPMALRLLGATSKEQIVASLHVIQSAPVVAEHFAEDLAALERGDAFSSHESVVLRIDGTPIHILQTVTFPRPESRGRALFSAIDITKRKQAEWERDQFFELSHDLFGITDFDGYFKRLNPAWEHTLGYSVAELIGTHFSALIDPDDLPATIVRHEQVQSSTGEHSFEIRYRARDGSYRWMASNAVSDPQHRLIYFTLRDITERRRTEDEIRRKNAQLETINRELEAFSYSISHDLRAPLRHIDGFATLLAKHADSTLDATGRHYLATISKSATKLGQLVDDLLDFSRIGRATLRLETVDNNTLVADVIRECGFNERKKINWDIGSLPTVTASNAMLRQVWTNLIDNAVKYSRASSQPTIVIAGHTDTAAGEHQFSVRDNGVGFEMAYVDKLFGVFQRLHGASEFEGTGIGLANVRRIILRHGGRVWADGKVGDGASFHFSLPIDPPIRGSIPPFTDA